MPMAGRTTAWQTRAPQTTARPAAPAVAPPLRASDDDRLAAVHRLQDAVGRGLLTPDECSDRMAAAFAAVHVRDLPPLTADLPPAVVVAAAPAPPGWRPLGTLAWQQLRASVAAARHGGPATWRLALAVLIAMVLLLTVLSLVAQGLYDAGPGDFGGPGFGGPDGFDGVRGPG
ncbi:DUF1707 SHOCT-like domain-containing protein [Geodermatophilus aquaeductus]|nr:DUF1707 domain-containing protein [Geodermatophilus aquaeductus]